MVFSKKGEKMKVFQTAQELINRIENSKGKGVPLVLLIMESIIEVEKNGVVQKFRLREFNDEATKAHLKIMKGVSGNSGFNKDTSRKLDDFGRKFTIDDFTQEELKQLIALADEVIGYFN